MTAGKAATPFGRAVSVSVEMTDVHVEAVESSRGAAVQRSDPLQIAALYTSAHLV